jgi:hypothetical protein
MLVTMGEEDVARAIQQKVAAGLINVVLAVILAPHSFAQQLKIAHQGGWRKDLKPRESLQVECVIRFPFRVGKNSERPLMLLLVANQLGRLGKRHDDNHNPTPREFRPERIHLAEVSLTGQSGEMPEKDYEQMLLKKIAERRRVSLKIDQGQFIERDLFGRPKRILHTSRLPPLRSTAREKL